MYLDAKYRINSHAYPTDNISQNGELNTAKFIAGAIMAKDGEFDVWKLGSDCLQKNSVGRVLHADWSSHDNITGLVSIAKMLGHPFAGVVKDSERKYHPRASIYWSWAEGPTILNTLGLILVCIANLYTCARHLKRRNGDLIIKTDNELLMILMYMGGLNTVWFCQWAGWICDKLLKRRFGDNYLHDLNDLRYTHDHDHPVKKMWQRIDREYKWWKK